MITAAFYCEATDTTTVSRRSDGAYSMKTWFKHSNCSEDDHKDRTERYKGKA